MKKNPFLQRLRYVIFCLIIWRLIRQFIRKQIEDRSKLTNKPREPTDIENIKEYVIQTTSKGKVKGVVCSSPTKHIPILNFRSIPYADPPIGKNRFLHPKERKSWNYEILDCTHFGRRAPQRTLFGVEVPLMPMWWLLLKIAWSRLFCWGQNRNIFDPEPLDPNQSEDCLTLNVSTPNLVGSLPVCVWIHGGAFILGHASEVLYAHKWGHPFAENGCVYVSINYRLGLFGYAKVEGGDYNNGLADQILALEWVQKEIARFGGDPSRVTVMGQSAGAMSIGAIIASPKSKGLIARAVLMSGATFHAISKDQAKKVSELFEEILLGRNPLTCSTAELITCQNILLKKINDELPFQPVVDGEFLLSFPNLSVLSGAARDLDLMVGTTAQEIDLFKSLIPIHPFSRWSCKKFFATIIELVCQGEKPTEKEMNEMTEKIMSIYLKQNSAYAPTFFKFVSELMFDAPGLLLCEAHVENCSINKKTFRYRFDYRGPFGAVHGIDLPFVFGTYQVWKTEYFMRRLVGNDCSNEKYEELSQNMIKAWTNFVKYGDPSDYENKPCKITWPQFTMEGRETYLFNLLSNSIRIAKGDMRDDDDAFDTTVQLVEEQLYKKWKERKIDS